MMWAVMMVAMMLPSASPMVMAYARSPRLPRPPSRMRVWLFAGGYVAVWTLFSAAATAMQTRTGCTRRDAERRYASRRPSAGAVILAAAGIYQLTPLKQRCLRHCQSPIGFFMTHWRDGGGGAFAMGLEHGAFCVGCCWMLMALLFVAGVMNLAWVAALRVSALIVATRWKNLATRRAQSRRSR